MSNTAPVATIPYTVGAEEDVLAFLKRARDELWELGEVRAWRDRLAVIGVNGDWMEITGLGPRVGKPFIADALGSINAAYDKRQIQNPTPRPYKEFPTGRRYPWAQDRVR